MRALACGWLLLAASLGSAAAWAQSPPPPAPEPAPPAPEPAPPTETMPPAAEASSADDATPPAAVAPAAPASPNNAPLDARRPGSTLVVGARGAQRGEAPVRAPFERDFDALPLTLEARFGFNARLSSAFSEGADEEHLDTNFALAGYLAWKPEYSLGVELEHTGLGRVRGMSGLNSLDATYSATGAWFAARVFPIRRERMDVFVNLRLGMVVQHLDAKGTRVGNEIAVPARPFSCSEWDGPGFGLGGAIGLSYRISRHFSFVSRVDATGHRLSGEPLGMCADGIGSVASVGGSVGLAYEFETAPR